MSIGIASTKTLAKVANRVAKKNPEYEGACSLIDNPKTDEILSKVDVEDIWGVGWQYSKLLRRNGIFNALEFRDANERWVKDKMTTMGYYTIMELRGFPCLELDEAVPPKKAIVTSRSFGRPVESLEELQEALATYITRAAEKLRKQQSTASIIQVFLTTNRFKNEPQYSNFANFALPTPTAFTPDIIHYAQQVLKQIYRKGYHYKKVGVMLAGILTDRETQYGLFSCEHYDKKQKSLMKAIDGINIRMGQDMVKFASSGIKQPWQMRQLKLSKKFTTSWDELPTVK